ncbi:MAG: PilN domain-containing protein [bacterium]|nr:PilN domain-containing protein [bacterium]
MINLLPPEQKEELLKEDKLKIILILESVILFIFISQGLLFFLIKNYILADLEIQKIYSKEREEELKVPVIKELEDKIKLSGQAFTRLNSFYQSQVDVAAVLEKISTKLPKEVYLTSLNFDPNSSKASLTGFAPTREKLLIFRENLENEKAFSEIYFPPGNWVNPVEINFNIVLKAK